MFRKFFAAASPEESAGAGSGEPAALKDFLETLVRALVDEPNEINVQEASAPEEGVRVFELRVAKGDLGKVIGKKGRTASAIRTILTAASRKYRISTELRILE